MDTQGVMIAVTLLLSSASFNWLYTHKWLSILAKKIVHLNIGIEWVDKEVGRLIRRGFQLHINFSIVNRHSDTLILPMESKITIIILN